MCERTVSNELYGLYDWWHNFKIAINVFLDVPRCIVQTYREWLRDADYDPSCKLCSRALSNEDCLRLPCFHLFHWSCLSEHCASLPDTTAPAGYQCPQCSQPIFPSANAGSLTSNLCMERLASVNWGRRGLGLPMFTENESSLPSSNDVSAPSGFSKDRFFPSQQTHQFTYDETTHLTRVPEVLIPTLTFSLFSLLMECLGHE
ncbi:unnamed protein product [Nesidiocoris tenuis]|uniref:Zinc finger protein-like 1 homolog n=1 Tax=Nesidiocoris tenuis TaxID=355587 RepID=A0A6H5HA42_9HEMI|nr:unnamed protein product [Nesidiocoris tenuis]